MDRIGEVVGKMGHGEASAPRDPDADGIRGELLRALVELSKLHSEINGLEVAVFGPRPCGESEKAAEPGGVLEIASLLVPSIQAAAGRLHDLREVLG